MTGKNDTPTFEAWGNDELVRWAYGTHDLVVEQQEQISQLQRDFKDAMQANRELLVKLKGADDDWK